MIAWSGIFHIMATPFTDAGDLDTAGLPRLVEAALATGVTGLTILGIAGEAHRLTDEERRRVVDATVKEVRGRVPVAVGVSASGTHLAAAFTRMAQDHGADALMVAPPAGLKNLDAVADYFLAVADAARVPLVLQDEPVTTQVFLPAPFVTRASAARSRGSRRSSSRKRPRCRRSLACASSSRRPWRSSAGWAACTSSRSSRAARTGP